MRGSGGVGVGRRRGQGAVAAGQGVTAARVHKGGGGAGVVEGLRFDLMGLEGGCWGIYIGEGRDYLG